MWVLLESKEVKLKDKELESVSAEKNDKMLMKNTRGRRKMKMGIGAAMEEGKNPWGFLQEMEDEVELTFGYEIIFLIFYFYLIFIF